ncbi:MAG: phosphoribosylamine--glycine ligase [Oscillibacter sp.]|nr:phosphoribosylamine--glycine ligase [Oscillibacter sp.]
MNLLVVGGGGREHAIIKKLKENPSVKNIYALPGNGGIARDAVCVPEIGATDMDRIVDFARSHSIGFAVVAPDDPLALGCVDRLHEAGIPCFGPDAKAARIEASKVFSKNLMKKYGIPTARYEVFDDPAKALAYLRQADFPIVVKADGLALGKGVLIPQNLEEAEAAVKTIMEDKAFGDSGNEIVIEEFLTGPEVSVLAFTDGTAIAPMVSSMDHKRAGDGDTGPNTGGMGTVAPNPCYTPEIAAVCMETIFLPTLGAMRAEGCPFKGCLYFGLMLTPDGPKVIEYNCRFGDPETQVVLPLLKTDLLTVMQAVENETLSDLQVEWSGGAAACVILASGGYPGSYPKGKEITVPQDLPANVTVYHAGDRLTEDGRLVTGGGRVLGVTATGDTLAQVLKDAYAAAERVEFEGKYLRHDIGRRALSAMEGR